MPERCCAVGLLGQHPHSMTELRDIILNGTVYDNFHGNSVEVRRVVTGMVLGISVYLFSLGRPHGGLPTLKEYHPSYRVQGGEMLCL